jgi:hypothetical protein
MSRRNTKDYAEPMSSGDEDVSSIIDAKKRTVFTLEDDVKILQSVKKVKRQTGALGRIKWNDVVQDSDLQGRFNIEQTRGHFRNLVKSFDNNLEAALKDAKHKMEKEMAKQHTDNQHD